MSSTELTEERGSEERTVGEDMIFFSNSAAYFGTKEAEDRRETELREL